MSTSERKREIVNSFSDIKRSRDVISKHNVKKFDDNISNYRKDKRESCRARLKSSNR